MDLLQLKYFVKIVEHRSFTKAARDCQVSQPALSQQISKLEKQLGLPILERRGRRIQLTTGGQLLIERAREILRLVEEAESQITDDGEHGRVSIAAIPTIGPFLLPRWMMRLQPQFPKAQFVIGEERTEQILEQCQAGEIDLGVMAMPNPNKKLTAEPLFEEPLYLAVSAQHRLARQPVITVGDLKREPLILLADGHCLAAAIRSFCERQKVQLVTTSRVQQLETVKRLVALGMGITFVPGMAADDDLGGQLVYRQLEGTPLTRTIAICWNPDRFQSQLFGNLLKAVREFADPAAIADSDQPTPRQRAPRTAAVRLAKP